MISVNVKFIGKEVKSLTVSGHANYDQYGSDIVCAGVSAIVTGGINALADYKDALTIIHEDNKLGFIIQSSSDEIQLIVNTLLIQLKTIEESYKKYIKIENKHGGV